MGFRTVWRFGWASVLLTACSSSASRDVVPSDASAGTGGSSGSAGAGGSGPDASGAAGVGGSTGSGGTTGGATGTGGSSDAASDGQTCQSRYLHFPKLYGAFVSFAGPDDPGGLVEMSIMFENNGGANLVRTNTDNTCGWRMSVSDTRVHVQIAGGALDHFVDFPFTQTGGWHQIRWDATATESRISIDGAAPSTQAIVGTRVSCPGNTTLGEWDLGNVDDVTVGASHWSFDEADGLARDSAGMFDGAVGPGVARECRP